MTYKPRPENARIIDAAWTWVQSVPYRVTARWVFYRLLQDGIYTQKAGYKHLLSLLSKARKEFYAGWHPSTLADDTRAALIRGDGYETPSKWLDALQEHLACNLDRWGDQPVYVECWFEAAAMQAQFDYYANENIPLLAFHGDVSIPEKWAAADRLVRCWLHYHKPITIYYFGDLDPKGLEIPESAWADIELWARALARRRQLSTYDDFTHGLTFTRLGLNPGDELTYSIPENPERPGTYQWEALADEDAARIIEQANTTLDLPAFEAVESDELEAAETVRDHLSRLEL